MVQDSWNVEGVKLYDLSQPWSWNTPAFPTDPNPVVRWVKRLASHGTNHQSIETTLHVGTHIDAPLHWVENARDVADMPLERLYGPASIVDISDQVKDYDIIDPEMIEAKGLVQDGDIVILYTGYNEFSAAEPDADEVRYFFQHPGGYRGLADWAVERGIRWLGADLASVDHGMNSNLREMWPHLAEECEVSHGKPLTELFPREWFQHMHIHLFRHDIPIVENIGGEIVKLLDRRVEACAFPWRFVGGEAALVRVVAFDRDAH